MLLHAHPFDARMFDPVHDGGVPGVRLLTPDVAGFGSSAVPATEPSLESVARQVLAVLDAEGLGRALVGGVSMGGYVAMALLRLAPRRVAGLVLTATRHTADDVHARERRELVAARVLAEEGVAAAVAGVPGLHGARTRAERPALVTAAEALVREQRPEAVAWAQRAMAARPDSARDLARAGVPALVVAGAEDEVVAAGESQALAALVGAEPVVLPAGHLVPWEAPAAYAAVLAGWVAAR